MQYRPFLSCNQPVKLLDSRGNEMYVPCGSCPICRRSKSLKYSQRLQLEEGRAKYSWFLTLTYNPWFIPTYKVVYTKEFSSDSKLLYDFYGNPVKSWYNKKLVTLKRYEDTERKDFWLLPQFDRVDRYGRPLDIDPIKLDLDENEIKSGFTQYNIHRKFYQANFCKTRFEHHDGYVDLCYPRDLELFLYAFKNFCRLSCGCTFRYFAVPDYGTNSINPHWHILIFSDSDELNAYFQDTIEVGTPSKPCQCARFLSEMWKYGIVNSQCVEKSVSSYISSYLNTPSDFPQIIFKISNYRNYHSNHLGEVLSEESITNDIRNANWTRFENLSFTNKRGDSFTYSLWRSFYDSWLPSFPYVGRKSPQTAYQLHEKLQQYLTKHSEYDHITDVATCLFLECQSIVSDGLIDGLSFPVDFYKPFLDLCSLVESYSVRSAPFTLKDISLFKNLFYTSNNIAKNVVKLYGKSTFSSLHSYFDLICRYQNYKEYKLLTDNYSAIENDNDLTECYYLSLSNAHQNTLLYRRFLYEQYEQISKCIKHRSTADKYRNVLFN